MWRTELKAFISDRQGGTASSARRIYVVADGSKDLVSVDLAPVFASSEKIARSISAIHKETGALASSGVYLYP